MMGRQNPEMTVQGAKVMCFTIANFRNQCPYHTESLLMGSGTPSSEDVFETYLYEKMCGGEKQTHAPLVF